MLPPARVGSVAVVATPWPRGDAVVATVVATGWPQGDAVVATGWPPRGGHGGTGAGSLIEPALFVYLPSEWRLCGTGGTWANKAPPARTLILYGFEARVAGEALVFHLLGENKK